ncbi:anti-sigma-F factor Fin [Sporosarcina sp. A2]|uniref:anti-sigma-F factor Fin n=1 Tax=Sporosarcina sp. A2 TaxID=3393449 RepID=UPI003D7C045F
MEVGSIPFASVKETIRDLQKADEKNTERFIEVTDRGKLEVRCICEQCERTMHASPNYYTVEKWLQ